MNNTGRMIWSGTAIFLSVLVLLISAASIVGVWVAERALANTAVQVLDSVDKVTASLRHAMDRVDQRLENMQAASTFVSTAAARASQKVIDDGVIRLLLPDEREQSLAAQASSVRDSLSPLRAMLTAGVTTYRSMDALPFIDLPSFSPEQIDQLEAAAGEVQSAADALEANIVDFRSGTGGRIDKLQSAADALTERLGQFRDRLANLDARLALAQESLAQLKVTVTRLMVLAALLLTVLIAWVIYSQVVVLRLSVQRWKATGRAAAAEPVIVPAPAVVEVATVSEPANIVVAAEAPAVDAGPETAAQPQAMAENAPVAEPEVVRYDESTVEPGPLAAESTP